MPSSTLLGWTTRTSVSSLELNMTSPEKEEESHCLRRHNWSVQRRDALSRKYAEKVFSLLGEFNENAKEEKSSGTALAAAAAKRPAGYSVVDCGAAPGAWSQVAVQRVNSTGTDPDSPRGTLIGIDLLNIPPLDGAHFLSNHDVMDPATHAKLQELLPGGQAHVILSDMAPNASGFRDMDHERIITMCFSLIDLAGKILQPRGSLLCKYWDGILTHQLQEKLSRLFGSVRSLKPDASRKDSAERFFLARMHKK
uniref:rRNA methyltransferase 2, mitochondrial n=1 Tax=Nothobranchius furzeri TaxID=105023 RepID=A0A8C6K584_NOTFU